jgi:hypothetical protein
MRLLVDTQPEALDTEWARRSRSGGFTGLREQYLNSRAAPPVHEAGTQRCNASRYREPVPWSQLERATEQLHGLGGQCTLLHELSTGDPALADDPGEHNECLGVVGLRRQRGT